MTGRETSQLRPSPRAPHQPPSASGPSLLPAQIEESASFIQARWSRPPRVGIILGSGLARLADGMTDAVYMPYKEIPHFLTATAVGHQGRLVCGCLAGVPVVVMQGRLHAYEGHPAERIAFPVRVMKLLGIELLIVSNASGGLNPNFRSGDVMVIEDHLNLMGVNPLIGIHDDRLGPPFPDMSAAYDQDLRDRAMQIARRENFTAHVGVYAAMRGPNFETRAEYRFLRRMGADVVGMSTVPEVIVAAHAGLPVLALSVVANLCRPDAPEKTSGEQVVAVVEAAAPKLKAIVLGVLETMG
ncbi:MAG: purine-nucleoside phosphorylase [Planctomycetales bacterium]|nr:purine-nucleoside phosphorylase [Planctomycetales bacterium]NIM08046.1 purine-nucleoside phosphorylase [Planctomycetales bacterium]NIN07537.1 purine-nucleoside phosphorylase [Planctomycetales bacterium]NIN76644.1 purine-nucleoside phosphorylase [Planctomycetales bacterium]NIO33832.1 purine-nucleoside phosphorylase [Planctomycetales bacterium]